MLIIVILCICIFFIFGLFFITIIIHHRKEKNENTVILKNEVFMEEKYDRIRYLKGDVITNMTNNIGEDEIGILLHICNNKGGWGAGFVLSLSQKWILPEQEYRKSFLTKVNHELGDIQIVQISSKIFVINMIAQNGYKTAINPVPLDYIALEKCFQKVLLWIDSQDFIFPQIYCPKIGTGLSGGKWEIISELLNKELGEIPIKVYEI